MPIDPQKRRKPLADYAKYSGIGIMMLTVILLGTYAGVSLDRHFGISSSLFTIICSLLSVAVALYLVVKKIS